MSRQQYTQQEIAARIGGVAPVPNPEQGYAIPEAKPRQVETHDGHGRKYLRRDDGVIYLWDPRLPWKRDGHTFTPISEIPREEIEKRERAEAKREATRVSFKAQVERQNEQRAALKAEASARIKAARAQLQEIDEAAAFKAQMEADEQRLMKADAAALAQFAMERFNIAMPVGDMDLMRDVVVDLWNGTLTEWTVGEPKSWTSKSDLAVFLRDKFFVKVPTDITLADAKAKVRALLDGYTNDHPGVGQENAR